MGQNPAMTDSPGPVVPSSPLPRGLIVLLSVAAAVVTVAGLKAFSSILGPVFLALMLTVAVHPLMGRLRGRGVPVWLATLLTLLATFAVVIALAAALALSVARLATLLPSYQDRFAALLGDVDALLASLGVGHEQVRAALSQIDLGTIAGLVGDVLVGLTGAFSDLVFILALLLFMGIDAARFGRGVRSLTGERPGIVTALETFARGTRSYLVVTTVFGLIVAVADTIAVWALGIPLPLLWGLLAFITNYIPNIGFIIGLAPPAILGLLEGGPKLMVIVIVVYCVINFVIQSVIQPKYVGDAVDLSLTLTFLSLVFWGWVVGPLGALLAIPLTLLTKALLVDIDPGTRWVSRLLTSSAVADVPPRDGRAEAEPGEPADGPSDVEPLTERPGDG